MAHESFREDPEYARLEKHWAETIKLEERLQDMMANPQKVGTPDLREVRAGQRRFPRRRRAAQLDG